MELRSLCRVESASCCASFIIVFVQWKGWSLSSSGVLHRMHSGDAHLSVFVR